MPYCLCHHLVVVRQGLQLLLGGFVKPAKRIGSSLGRHAIGLWEHDVEANNERTELGQLRDQIGYARAWPRPLAERLEAFLVDIDDDDGSLFGDARRQLLEEVESLKSEFLDWKRIGDTQENQRE